MTDSDYCFKIDTELSGGEDIDSVGSFNWGNVAALGTMSVATVKEGFDDSELEKISDSFAKASDKYIAIQSEQGYGIPITASTSMVNGEEIEGYP